MNSLKMHIIILNQVKRFGRTLNAYKHIIKINSRRNKQMINFILIYLIIVLLLILFFQSRSENEDIEECKKVIRLNKYSLFRK